MVQKQKKGKDRLDKFYHLAKEHGYRSRASFKLTQLNKKFNFLEKANVLLDLCAAPGSWCQVAAKFMPAGKTIIGVDLDPIKPIPGVITFVNDITTQSCRQEIKKHIKGAKCEVVLHDGAPNVGTAWSHDAYMQAELTLSACRLATEFLAANGTFVTKVFRSAEYTKLLWVFNQLFARVTPTKPQASRNVSAEIFVVCEGFLAPKKIDPKLLDPKFVLSTVETKVAYDYGVASSSKQKRHRTGYEDGVGPLLSKKATVADYFSAQDPVTMLSQFSALTFDDEQSKKYIEHPSTTPEIKILLSDLKILGKRDFKILLRWRMKIVAMEEKAAKEAEESEDDWTPLTKEEEDIKMLREMEDKIRELGRIEKRKMKKLLALRAKNRRRMALTMPATDEFEDPGAERDSLFNLGRINKTLATDVAPDIVVESSEEEEPEEEPEDEDLDVLSEDELTRRYEAQLESTMDTMYLQYLIRRKSNRKRALEKLNNEALDDVEQAGDGGVLDLGSDEDIESEAPSKLLVEDSEAGSIKARQWFDDNTFGSAVDNINDETAEMQRRIAALMEAKKAKRASKMQVDSSSEDADDEDESRRSSFAVVPEQSAKGFGTDSEDDKPAKKKKKAGDQANGDVHIVDVKKMNAERDSEKAKEVERRKSELEAKKAKKMDKKSADPVAKDKIKLEKTKAKKKAEGKANKMDFSSSDSDDAGRRDGSSEDSEESSFEDVENAAVALANESDTEYDTDEKAEIMALAKNLQDPTKRAEILAASYNRRNFTDRAELPKWFVDEDQSANVPIIPITKEEYQAHRANLKAIDSRATHRVAEAQARKKLRTQRAMEKAKQKAGRVLESEDMPEGAKRREMERIFRKAKSKVRPTKTYIVAAAGRLEHGSKGKGSMSYARHVDSRLKKDKRGSDARDRKRKRK